MEFIDKFTEESLEIQYILNKINTLTPYGKMYKEKTRPFLPGEEEKLREELDKIELYMEYTKEGQFTREINNIFYHIKDLRQSVKKAKARGILSEVELFELKQFLFLIRDLDNLLNKYNIPLWEDMEIQPIEQLEKLLDPEGTGISTFYIYDSYSEELTKLRHDKREIEKNIKREKGLKRKHRKRIKYKIKTRQYHSIVKDRQRINRKIGRRFSHKLCV